jgi:hypothetical protein
MCYQAHDWQVSTQLTFRNCLHCKYDTPKHLLLILRHVTSDQLPVLRHLAPVSHKLLSW